MYNNTNYRVIIQQYPKPNDVTGGIKVVASLPSSFTFDSRSDYQAPYAQGVYGNGNLANLAKFGGIRLTSQALTAQIWQGSTETELGLELEFHADTDPIADVRDPILALMKLATAKTSPGTGMLQSPGPQIDLELAGMIAKESGAQLANSFSQVTDALSSVFKPAKLNSETTSQRGNSGSNAEPNNGGLGQAKYWKDRVRNQISIKIGRYGFFDSIVVTNVQKTYESQPDEKTGWPMYAKVAIQFRPLFLLVQEDLDQIFAIRR